MVVQCVIVGARCHPVVDTLEFVGVVKIDAEVVLNTELHVVNAGTGIVLLTVGICTGIVNGIAQLDNVNGIGIGIGIHGPFEPHSGRIQLGHRRSAVRHAEASGHWCRALAVRLMTIRCY
mgnify:CR=1 FL=1